MSRCSTSRPALRRLREALRRLDFDKYVFLTTDPLYIESYLSSLRIAGLSTALVLLIGYPIAYAMARAPRRLQPLLVMLVVLPFWTSFLIRIYAWMGILARDGYMNQALIGLGADLRADRASCPPTPR